MRMVGLEPTRGHPRKILSLVRLPFRHIRIWFKELVLQTEVYDNIPKYVLQALFYYLQSFFPTSKQSNVAK